MERRPGERAAVEVCGEHEALLLSELAETTFRETYSEQTSAAEMNAHVSASFNPEAMRAELAAPATTFLLARVDGQPVGFEQLSEPSAPPGEAEAGLEIRALYVLRTHHGLGVGGRLLDKAIERAREAGAAFVWLQVWELNQAGRRFWLSRGFSEIGAVPFSFGATRHRDLLMRLNL